MTALAELCGTGTQIRHFGGYFGRILETQIMPEARMGGMTNAKALV